MVIMGLEFNARFCFVIVFARELLEMFLSFSVSAEGC